MNTSKMGGLIGGQVDTKLLGEADWATWKFKLTVLLRATNLFGITDGTTLPLVKEESKQDYAKWAEKDAKAQTQQKFFEVKCKKNKAVSEYLRRVDAILDNLKSLGADVNESMVITKIISSLPGQYQHFISAWESMPAEQRKMDS
ncbi:hypothetical protein PR048_011768 [Dryococelus australis]|uniref:Uncharacterized protein n=1 Tax=Dryococelus australis TaxID=614101 RepID=A0ABQ9HMF7_9NEOP|nr:hypothetical protein PR048_011768 [Dryococelus australis]